MIKIEIISASNAMDFKRILESLLNEKGKPISIQYHPTLVTEQYTNGIPSKSTFYDRALVIYDDEKGEEK